MLLLLLLLLLLLYVCGAVDRGSGSSRVSQAIETWIGFGWIESLQGGQGLTQGAPTSPAEPFPISRCPFGFHPAQMPDRNNQRCCFISSLECARGNALDLGPPYNRLLESPSEAFLGYVLDDGGWARGYSSENGSHSIDPFFPTQTPSYDWVRFGQRKQPISGAWRTRGKKGGRFGLCVGWKSVGSKAERAWTPALPPSSSPHTYNTKARLVLGLATCHTHTHTPRSLGKRLGLGWASEISCTNNTHRLPKSVTARP